MTSNELMQRVLHLEDQLHVANDFQTAMKEVVFQTLQLLHESNVLRMQEVADSVDASAAFGKAGFDRSPPELLSSLTKALRMVGEALDLKRAGLG